MPSGGRSRRQLSPSAERWKIPAGSFPTHAEPHVVTGGTFVLGDQTPGATVHFRVRGMDAKIPGGYTEWTAWVAVMVSA